MATELGVAYLSLVADTKQLAPSVRKAMGGVEKESKESGNRSALGFAATWAKRGAKVLGGAAIAGVGSVAGVAITKGFNRALQLQDAEAKLSGLGHSGAATAKIMDSALAAVKGTAFGMGDAATVAASTVAAGVKPGKDLERTLTLVGDAATIAGTDMGSMGDIFNKVAATNRLTLGVANQLGAQGIPVLQLVAKEMGVTAEEASKMVSKGEVDFATFQRAMEAGLGGAAKKSGETFRGSLANMGAALGRLGVAFMDPVVNGAPKLFTAITNAIDSLNESEVFQSLAAKFSDWLLPALDRTSKMIDRFDFDKMIQSMKGTTGPIATLMTALSPLGIILKGMRPVLPQIGEALAGIGKAIGGTLATVLPVIADAFLAVGEALAGAVSKVLPSLIPVFNALAAAIAAAGPALAVLVPLLAQMVVWAIELVTPILASEKAVTALVIAFVAWKTIPPVIAAVRGALALFRAVQLGVTASTYGASGAMVVAGASAKVYGVIMKAQAIATKVASAATWLFNAALRANPIGIVITLLAGLVAGLVWFFTKTKAGQAIVQTVWGGIKTAIKAVSDWWTQTAWPAIKKGFDVIGAVAKWLYNKIIKPIWTAIKVAIALAIAPIILYIKGLIWVFKNALAPAAKWLYKNIIKPVWNNILGAIRAVVNWFKNTAWPIFKLVVTILAARFVALWNKLKAVWAAIKNNVIKPVVEWFKNTVWPIVKAVVGHFVDRFNVLKNRLKAIWGAIKNNIIKPVVDWFTGTVRPRIQSFADSIREAFASLRGAIKRIWNRIKAVVKAPAKIIVDLIYNKGIVPLVNGVWEFLQPKSDPVLSKVNMDGWATGGYTGPGSKYQPAGVVHADEFVVRKESRKKFERRNPGALDHLNRTGDLPGFARGGRVGEAAKWWQDKGARVTEFGGWGQSVARVHMKNSRHYANAAADLNYASSGPIEQGFFDRNVGAFRSLFPDINVLWRVPNHYDHMHIDDGAHGINGKTGPGGGGFDFMGVINKLRNLKKGLSDLADSGVGRMFKGVGRKIIDGPIGWIKDKAGAALNAAFNTGSGKSGDSQVVGAVKSVAANYGWDSGRQWEAINWIINKESSWDPQAANKTSSARGLFQKMTSLHGPLESSVWGQAKWGLDYIKRAYNNPVNAMSKHKMQGWYADGGRVTPTLYDQGGWLPKGLSVVENKTGKPEPVLNPAQWDAVSNGGGPRVENHFYGITDAQPIIAAQERSERRAAIRANMGGLLRG